MLGSALGHDLAAFVAAFRAKVSSVVENDFASLKPLYQKIVAEGAGN